MATLYFRESDPVPDPPFSAYEWMCLERPGDRVTMPRRLVDMCLVQSRIGPDEHTGEIGLTWSITDLGELTLNRHRRGEI